MRLLTRRLLILALFAGSVSTAAAQTTTTTGATGTSTSSTSGNSGVSGANTGFTNQGMQAAPQITGGGATGAQVNGTNAFASYYANPQYQGRPGSTGNDNPGGFGTALSGGSSGARTGTSSGTLQNRTSTGSTQNRTTGSTGTSGTSSIGSTGAASSTAIGQGFGSGFGTGTTGTGTTGRGGTTGFGGGTTGFGNSATSGFGNSRNSMFGGTQQNQPGVIIPQVSPVRYMAAVRIPAPQIAPSQMATDLRATLDRSSFVPSARGIQISMDAGQVVLRGTVKDEEEARTAEGIIRLTPGVRGVKNELQFPKQ